MTSPSRSDVELLLETLQTEAPGRVMAANILHSLREGLVNEAMVADWLLECAETVRRRGASDPLVIFQDVCAGFGANGRHHLRHCRRGGLRADATLSTSMRTS